MSDGEASKLINENFQKAGGDYDFVAYEEANNYSCYEFDVKKNDIMSFDRAEIDNGKFMYNFRALMCFLAEKDVVEEGTYLVKVFW